MNRKKKKAISKSQIIYDVRSIPDLGMGGDDMYHIIKGFRESGVLLYSSLDELGESTNKPQIIPHNKRVRIKDVRWEENS